MSDSQDVIEEEMEGPNDDAILTYERDVSLGTAMMAEAADPSIASKK